MYSVGHMLVHIKKLNVEVDVYPFRGRRVGRMENICAMELDWMYSWIGHCVGRIVDVASYFHNTFNYLRAVLSSSPNIIGVHIMSLNKSFDCDPNARTHRSYF